MHAFLDTMMFLHFRHPAEVDWRNVLGADVVELVVCKIVIRELDRHKDGSRANVKDRARRSLRDITRWSGPVPFPLREGVTVRVVSSAPVIDWNGWSLDPQRADDALVRAARSYAGEVSRGVAVISDGVGPRLTARRLGLVAIEPSDVLRLPEEKDPLAAENERLQRQISDLRGRPMPSLSLLFNGSDKQFQKFPMPLLAKLTSVSASAWIRYEPHICPTMPYRLPWACCLR